MSYVSIEFVRAYGKIEEDPDELVQTLTNMAEDYLAGAGITPGLAKASLYKVAVAGIALHFHENRVAVDQTSPKDFEPGLRWVINQLKQDCGVLSILDNNC